MINFQICSFTITVCSTWEANLSLLLALRQHLFFGQNSKGRLVFVSYQDKTVADSRKRQRIISWSVFFSRGTSRALLERFPFPICFCSSHPKVSFLMHKLFYNEDCTFLAQHFWRNAGLLHIIFDGFPCFWDSLARSCTLTTDRVLPRSVFLQIFANSWKRS